MSIENPNSSFRDELIATNSHKLYDGFASEEERSRWIEQQVGTPIENPDDSYWGDALNDMDLI